MNKKTKGMKKVGYLIILAGLLSTRWVKLSDLYFDVVNISFEHEFVHILDQRHGCYFGQYSCFETAKGFGIIPSDHELVA